MRMLKATITAALLLSALTYSISAQDKSGEAKFDRENYRKSAMSVARPDMLACRNADAQITQGRPVDVDAFARALHGTWVNKNTRTYNGLVAESDAVLFINMQGRTGTAILIDRNNIGHDLSNAVLASARTAPAAPLAISYVHCGLQFVDQYIKVSDTVQVPALAAGARVAIPPSITRATSTSGLKGVWDQLVTARYFDSFEMRTSSGARAKTTKLSAKEGDNRRVAVTPEGIVVSEKEIESGLVPSAENRLPSIIGGFFQIILAPHTGDGRKHPAVNMRWEGEYRSSGTQMEPGKPIYGIEQGIFASEGGAYVAANRMERTIASNGVARDIAMLDAYATSECGDKSGFLAGVANSNPNPELLNRLRMAAPNQTSDQTILVFDRVVIGTPGGVRR